MVTGWPEPNEDRDMKTLESIVESLSGKTYEGNELENAVWLDVCNLTDAEWQALANMKLDADGTPANGSRAQALYPNFADPGSLGEFDNLEAAQDLCQRIYNAVDAVIE